MHHKNDVTLKDTFDNVDMAASIFFGKILHLNQTLSKEVFLSPHCTTSFPHFSSFCTDMCTLPVAVLGSGNMSLERRKVSGQKLNNLEFCLFSKFEYKKFCLNLKKMTNA